MAAPNVLQPYIQNYTATFDFKTDGVISNDKTQATYCFKQKELGNLSSDKYCILVKPANLESALYYSFFKVKASAPIDGGILFSANCGNEKITNYMLRKDHAMTINITIITDTNQ